MAKNILSLSSEEVLNFLLKSEQYHNFELPEYFSFDEVLLFVSNTISDKSISDKSYEECVFV